MKTFSMGMNKDTELLGQPEGTFRDALNVNIDYTQGSVINEEGVTIMGSTDKFIVCGYSVLEDDRVVLFGRQETDTLAADGVNYTYYHQIKLFFPKEDYSLVLYQDNALNFQPTHFIQTTHRKNQAGETLVYFTDGYFTEGTTGIPSDEPYLLDYNPPRVFNVDKQYKRITQFGDPYTRLYGNSKFTPDNLRLIPYIGPRARFDVPDYANLGAVFGFPINSGVKIRTGGALKCGAYHLALSYEDDEGQTTNYFELSPAAYITSGDEKAVPTTSLTGGTGSLPTNKSISWVVVVPERCIYNKIKPAVVAINDEVITAYELPAVQIVPGNATYITYTGLEEAASVAVEDIVIDDAEYLVAQTITQQNNRLYLGNLKTNKDIGYQGYANNIKLDTVVKPFAYFSPRMYDTAIINYGYSQMLMAWGKDFGQSFKTDAFEGAGSTFNLLDSGNQGAIDDRLIGAELTDSYIDVLTSHMVHASSQTVKNGYKNPAMNYALKSYRRGEIYAFYISFVLKDGSESYAYHIPGRAAKQLDDGTNGSSSVDTGALFEDDLLNGLPTVNDAYARDSHGMHPGEFKSDKSVRVCEIVDTTDHTRTTGYVGNSVEDPQTTAFWSNANEVYPNTPDFSIKRDVNPDGTVSSLGSGGALTGRNVRHHKMPSNHSRQVDGFMTAATVDGDYITEEAIIDGSNGVPNAKTNVNPTQSKPLKTKESINVLGIQLSNIKIPKHILQNVQGYKIYYAKRKPEDKTILGQSIAIPAHPRYASVPEQSVVQAKKGPYYRGWYLYGGLRSDTRAGVEVSPLWRTRDLDHTYVASPVFTFHDFNMLRRKSDLSAATHISAQYGIVFRHFMGGPGQFIPPCDYDKLKFAHQKTGANYGYLNNLEDAARECTVLPSSGWVSTELRNTVSFTKQNGIIGTSYVVDISDNVKNTAFKLQDGNYDPDANSLENYQLGRITGQQDDDDTEQGPSVEQYRLSRLQRVRAYFTGMFIGTAYVNPYDCLQTSHIIKGNDRKNSNSAVYVNSDWQDASEFSGITSTKTGNLLNLKISPKSSTYIEGNSTTKLHNANAFLGATFLYNRGGESSILIGLESGLPLLRGHLPRFEAWNGEGLNYSFHGLSRWSESQFFYFPDAPDTSHPLGGLTRYFEYAGTEADPNANLENPASTIGGDRYDPESGRGMNFAMLPYKTDIGMPMAWLVNLCAAKTDVFNPFDRQELVWTGYYVEVDEPVTQEDGTIENDYYNGETSPYIFGGDTFISKYSFRTTSQSYGHCHFRLNSRDPGIKNIKSDDTDLNMYAFEGYYSPNITSGNNEDIFYKIGSNDLSAAGIDDEGGYRRDQGDVPLSIGGLSNSYGLTNGQLIWRLNAANVTSDYQSDPYNTRNQITVAALMENGNWMQGTVDPVSSLFEFFVESDDNIELRHSNPVDDNTRFLGTSTAKQIIFAPPTDNLTATTSLLYSQHYSALQDKKVTIPLPTRSRLKDVDTFEIRVARSTVDSGSLADGYRKFKALDYKDIDSNRGDIRNMFSIAGSLYIHTKRAMFMTRGKEELQLSAVNAFIGSGDIFSQDPDEMGQSYLGMGGTDSRYAHVTTEHGHFFINRADRAVYSMAGGQIQRISDSGMKTWFRDNLEFKLKEFGIDLDGEQYQLQDFYSDATTAKYGIGFTIGYDPKYKRIMITKREPIPTQKFREDYFAGKIRIINNIPTTVPGPDEADAGCIDLVTAEQGGAGNRGQAPNIKKAATTTYCGPIGLGNPVYFTQGGWTVSYYPEKGVWGSRHSYLPDLYISTSTDMFTVAEDQRCDTCRIRLWKHGNKNVPGGFYGEVYRSEIEFVENTAPTEPKLFSSIFYWADSYKENTSNPETDRKTTPGFTSFYVYNSNQISGTGESINYLSNARLVNRMWQLNNFRDLTKQETITEGRLISPEPNLTGGYTNSVITNQQTISMFQEEGVVNPNYIDVNKSWFNKGKFMDHYLVVRLINDNSSGNLLHLHGAGANFRKSYR